MKFTLPDLPYSFGALEPYIDAKTMEVHHNGHHKAYVDNLNDVVSKQPELKDLSLDALLLTLDKIENHEVRTAIRNNAGGHYNHSFFWKIMKKPDSSAVTPKGIVVDQIKSKFSSFDAFKNEFNTAAKKVFGSGWAWLCIDKNGELVIVSLPNQDCPITGHLYPVLGLDVWEHAYYLKYQNKRVDYIQAWWNVINWEQVNENYAKII